jgi:putative membrane protein
MKKNCYFTRLQKHILIGMLGLGIVACEKKSKSKEEVSEINLETNKILKQSKEMVEEAKTSTAKHNEKDALFLTEAAEINLEEIDLGKLAQKYSKDEKVLDMAKMMVEQHTKSMAELTALANKKSISLPNTLSEKNQEEYRVLKSKSGKEFNDAYCEKMVSKHKMAVEKFEKASAECKDADIKSWVTAAIPTLKAQLNHALMCEKKSTKK